MGEDLDVGFGLLAQFLDLAAGSANNGTRLGLVDQETGFDIGGREIGGRAGGAFQSAGEDVEENFEGGPELRRHRQHAFRTLTIGNGDARLEHLAKTLDIGAAFSDYRARRFARHGEAQLGTRTLGKGERGEFQVH